MVRWMKPSEELPRNMEVGDRIVGIVYECRTRTTPAEHRLVILEATERGWCAPDSYGCYSPEDFVLWAYENDIVRVATVAALLSSKSGLEEADYDDPVPQN